jgi:general L-amino acid transport system substrate-binding protein
MRCSSCGKSITGPSPFCPYCGTRQAVTKSGTRTKKASYPLWLWGVVGLATVIFLLIGVGVISLLLQPSQETAQTPPTTAPAIQAERVPPDDATSQTVVEVTRIVVEYVEVNLEVEVTRVVEIMRDQPTSTPEPVIIGNTLGQIRSRGFLRCGGNDSVPGFGYLDPNTTTFRGLDSDFCRVMAAAVLGDANALEIIPSTAANRFPMLQTGEVDVTIRNTTHTLTRETALGVIFGPVIFYDGQGFMVRRDRNITRLGEAANETVCVQSGTTTERSLTAHPTLRSLNLRPQAYPDHNAVLAAYDNGECTLVTSDVTGLVSQLTLLSDPAAHIILPAVFTEPLAPLVRDNDAQWSKIVRWSVYCTIAAEEYGITSQNVNEMLGSNDPMIQNLLGEAGNLGTEVGLDSRFCYEIIRQVGNYAEIYDRNLSVSPFNLPRGANALYRDGGLLYAPPFR